MKDELKVYNFVKSMFKIIDEIDPEKKQDSDEASARLLSGQTKMQEAAGVILESEALRLRRLIFRITKGKGEVFLGKAFEQNEQMKIVFLVITLGNDKVKAGVRKVCESFMGTNVDVPHHDNIPTKIAQHQEQIDITTKMISDSQSQLKKYFSGLNYANAEAPKADEIANLMAYKWLLAKEKAILTAINMMRPRQNNYIGFLWSPSVDENDIQEKLAPYVGATFEKFKEGEGITELNPPTYIKTNELTEFF
jgi:hypothetical protein